MENKEFKYEMHLHTREFGWCAKVWAEDIVDNYVRAGYNGICVTNHYFKEAMDLIPGKTWENKVDQWLKGYEAAKARAKNYKDFDVILGAELLIEEGYEDFLLYGITRKILIDNPDIFDFTLEECFEFANQNNLLLFQAHPFRSWVKLRDVSFLHGIEVFNGNQRHNSQNGKALAVAKKSGLLMIAGSDYHEIGDEGTAAMLFPDRIKDSFSLVKALKNKVGKIWTKDNFNSHD